MNPIIGKIFCFLHGKHAWRRLRKGDYLRIQHLVMGTRTYIRDDDPAIVDFKVLAKRAADEHRICDRCLATKTVKQRARKA